MTTLRSKKLRKKRRVKKNKKLCQKLMSQVTRCCRKAKLAVNIVRDQALVQEKKMQKMTNNELCASEDNNAGVELLQPPCG